MNLALEGMGKQLDARRLREIICIVEVYSSVVFGIKPLITCCPNMM